MENFSWLQIATYVSYLFITIAYTVKAVKYVKMPVHLRWELYPVALEKERQYGGSYLEDLEWQTKPRHKSFVRGVFSLLKEYLYFGQYYQRNKGYWLGLYPWHMGFYLIVSLHVLCFFSALVMLTGVSISAESANILGRAIYYLTLVVGIGSFVTGSIGCVILLIKRLVNRDLRTYASPANYFNYLFFLAVFLSGFCAWYFFDPTLSAYREFWKSLVTFHPIVNMDPASSAHIILFSLFLIYLPFTRSMHYITRFFNFFWVHWDDEPNLRGSNIERKVKGLLNYQVSWSAPHIQSGKRWGEVTKALPEDMT
jgi:nitrate reductase gamma subunit